MASRIPGAKDGKRDFWSVRRAVPIDAVVCSYSSNRSVGDGCANRVLGFAERVIGASDGEHTIGSTRRPIPMGAISGDVVFRGSGDRADVDAEKDPVTGTVPIDAVLPMGTVICSFDKIGFFCVRPDRREFMNCVEIYRTATKDYEQAPGEPFTIMHSSDQHEKLLTKWTNKAIRAETFLNGVGEHRWFRLLAFDEVDSLLRCWLAPQCDDNRAGYLLLNTKCTDLIIHGWPLWSGYGAGPNGEHYLVPLCLSGGCGQLIANIMRLSHGHHLRFDSAIWLDRSEWLRWMAPDRGGRKLEPWGDSRVPDRAICRLPAAMTAGFCDVHFEQNRQQTHLNMVRDYRLAWAMAFYLHVEGERATLREAAEQLACLVKSRHHGALGEDAILKAVREFAKRLPGLMPPQITERMRKSRRKT